MTTTTDWRELRDTALDAIERVATKRYVCSGCGASGVKLWRQYQTMADYLRLLCKDCAEKDQEEKLTEESDSLGWLVPAVPTELPNADGDIPEGETFWGYTSVPGWGCKWWWELPPEIPRSKFVDVTKFLTREQEEAAVRERERTDEERRKRQIAETVYMVEATHEESFMLWQEWHQVLRWEQDNRGCLTTVGKFGDMPVNVTVFWYIIEGKRVGFYSSDSMVTHHKMVEEWVQKTFPQCFKEDGRWKHTNAGNFGHCLGDIAPKAMDNPVAKARHNLIYTARSAHRLEDIIGAVQKLVEATTQT
jgi:hypothetical protein